MRKPPVKADAAADARRVEDAVAKAKRDLWVMINRLHLEEKNPAEAAYYQAIDLTTRILNDPDADKLVRKYASAPDARDKIISALPTGQPPQWPKQGRRRDTNTLRDRWIADIIERIRLLGFNLTRGDATRDKATRESAPSIVATAWAQLKSELASEKGSQELRAVLIEQGFTPPQADLRIRGLLAELSYGLTKGTKKRKAAKGLGESQLQKIYKESLWAKRAQSLRAILIEQGFTPQQAESRVQILIQGPRKALSEGSHQRIYDLWAKGAKSPRRNRY